MFKRTLFLCTGNYYRSRFAEEIFNHYVERQGLNWRASSRALVLEHSTSNIGPISKHTVKALKDRNILAPGCNRFPQACSIADLELADLVFAMKDAEHREPIRTKFPGWEDRVTFWNVHDIDAACPREATELIERLVRNLIKTLASHDS